ncbi:MAG: hypothetical protein ACK5C3_13470 [bacterium]|jgi:hypothetical protein
MSHFRLVWAAASAAILASQSASAAITIFTNKPLYDAQTAALAGSLESFDSYSGSYTSPLVGVAGDVTWSATSASGFQINGGQMSTQMPGAMVINFSGVDVFGVYGNFFGTDITGSLAPGLVLVTLADGTGSLLYVDNPNVFFGFYSDGPAITSITVSADALSGGAPVLRASVDNLGFSYVIPAPGAAALLGVAGLVGLRRRR